MDDAPGRCLVLPMVTLIVDSDAQDRRALHRLLEALPDVNVVAECGAGCQAVDAIEEHRPDLAFLRIDLPDMDGFELLERCDPAWLPWIVYVTNCEEYASEAFAAHALDYLIKPIAPGRLREAVERARAEKLRKQALSVLTRMREALEELGLDGDPAAWEEGMVPSPPAGHAFPANGRSRPARSDETRQRKLMVKRAGRVILLDPSEIDWVEAVGCYSRLHLGDAEYLHRITMKELGGLLQPTSHFRIHRSYLVRLDRIREVRPSPSGDHEYLVTLEDGTRLPLSRRRRPDLLERLSLVN